MYAAVLRNRLEREVEERKILAESQVGFRKGRGTAEGIFILNHVLEKELSRRYDDAVSRLEGGVRYDR